MPFDFIGILLRIPAALIAFAAQGFGSAYMSHKLGDPTPKNEGKLNLSPATHIDPFGFIMILLVGFGWTKPVNTNPQYYKNPKRDQILVALAGPMTNILVAILFAFLSLLSEKLLISYMSNSFQNSIVLVFGYGFMLNIYFALFTLLPIPFLPGYKILSVLLANHHSHLLYKIEQNSMLIIIGVIILFQIPWFRPLDLPFQILAGVIYGGFRFLFNFLDFL